MRGPTLWKVASRQTVHVFAFVTGIGGSASDLHAPFVSVIATYPSPTPPLRVPYPAVLSHPKHDPRMLNQPYNSVRVRKDGVDIF